MLKLQTKPNILTFVLSEVWNSSAQKSQAENKYLFYTICFGLVFQLPLLLQEILKLLLCNNLT